MPRGVYTRKPRNTFAAAKNADLARMMNVKPAEVVQTETDEEIAARLTERFEVLEEITQAAIESDIRALIVSGPAGLGKSYTVEEKLVANGVNVDSIIKGYVRPSGLFKTLYQHRHEGSVLVFDDADSIFGDDISLTFLKAVLDSADRRIVSYLAETRLIDEETAELLPKSFQFDGTIIFITNLDFDDLIARGSKMAPHLEALMSRAHYIDLTMKTTRDYMVRIQQVVKQGLLSSKGYDQTAEDDILGFINKNKDNLRELSLRMVLKVAKCYGKGGNWQRSARVTCCR